MPVLRVGEHVRERIHGLAVHVDLVVQVRRGGEARRADGGDQLIARDQLPRAHRDARAVRESRTDPVAVVDLSNLSSSARSAGGTGFEVCAIGSAKT